MKIVRQDSSGHINEIEIEAEWERQLLGRFEELLTEGYTIYQAWNYLVTLRPQYSAKQCL